MWLKVLQDDTKERRDKLPFYARILFFAIKHISRGERMSYAELHMYIRPTGNDVVKMAKAVEVLGEMGFLELTI
jgi:hypothetical protein